MFTINIDCISISLCFLYYCNKDTDLFKDHYPVLRSFLQLFCIVGLLVKNGLQSYDRNCIEYEMISVFQRKVSCLDPRM